MIPPRVSRSDSGAQAVVLSSVSCEKTACSVVLREAQRRCYIIKNNYLKEVFNGDTGHITDIDTEERTIKVEYDDQTVEYDSSEFDELALAYATTIHKSQGSEYSIVIIPVTEAHHRML